MDDKIYQVMQKYKNLRPLPSRNLDQFLADDETMVNRANLLASIDKLDEKNIVFLGDDDLGSIALALIAQIKKIVVFDIDQRLLDYITMVADKENLNIECHLYDLRKPLPKNILDTCDIVFFDPPYTPSATDAWLSRALEASVGTGTNFERKNLSNLIDKKFFMCFGYTDKSRERGLKIQKLLNQRGLIIQNKFRDFNSYHLAKSIGSKSDLYELGLTPKINLRKLDVGRSSFYTGETTK